MLLQQKAGQPRKHTNGWGRVNARINLSNEAFEVCRKLQKEHQLHCLDTKIATWKQICGATDTRIAVH